MIFLICEILKKQTNRKASSYSEQIGGCKGGGEEVGRNGQIVVIVFFQFKLIEYK